MASCLEVPPLCIVCGNDELNLVKLTCGIHDACRGCMNSKGWRDTHPNMDDIFSCEECNKQQLAERPPDLSSVYIFMDHSNTWIEAKKLDSKQVQQGKENSLIRVDVGQLLHVIVGNRNVAVARLYGSEPPPVDSVWRRMEERGWKLDIKERSQCTNKEKKVDTQIASDATEAVCDNSGQNPQNNILVLVSGDSDMIPAIEKAKKREWQVEVYTWKHAVSREIRKYPEIKVCFLDDFEDKILFTSMKFPIAERPELLQVVRQNGLVCTMVPDAFGKHNTPSREWYQEIQKRFKTSLRYYQLGNNILCLVFEKEKIGSDKVAEVIRHHTIKPISKVKKMQSYLQYEQALHKKADVSLLVDYETPRAYALLGQLHCDQLGEADSGFEVDRGNEDGDQTNEMMESVSYTDIKIQEHDGGTIATSTEDEWSSGRKSRESEIRKKKKSQRYSTPCPNGKDCRDGMKCKHKHTDEEKDYFRSNKLSGKYHKIKPCLNQACPFLKQIEKCKYAHGADDAFCLRCRRKGHFTDSCKQ